MHTPYLPLYRQTRKELKQYMENNKKPDVSFVWKITDDVLRDTFKKNEIGDVILPFVVIRRIDCILKPYNETVRKNYEQFKDKIADQNLEKVLFKAAGGKKFYNTSKHTLVTLLDDARNCEINFKNYLNGFNKEVRDILTNFQFDKVVAKLIRNGLLYQMIQEICELDFSPEKIDNHDMGYIFEELIRISNENSNETAGEHFTPRDVIRLMSAILFTPDKDILNRSGIIRTIYDPACGTGGMVNVGKNYILENICTDGNVPTIRTYGQELNEQSYAIAKSEALITGENADNIKLGNSFTQDQFKTNRFHYIMANPPYGVTWKKDQDFILNESLNPDGRFYAGTPRVSDGQLLFIQHMISKMEPDGARIGVVTNESPLFSGGAGSGESNIRKWIIENDWLECIIALPKDLFYNTGIFTYIWFITNKKSAERKGKVQLINAVDYCVASDKNLGNKRNDITAEQLAEILSLYLRFEDNMHCRILNNEDLGCFYLTIEQPKRLEDGSLDLKRGEKQADPDKREYESVALTSDISTFFENTILPFIDNDSWIDYAKTRINYVIRFNQYFHETVQYVSSESIRNELGAELKLPVVSDYAGKTKDTNIDWIGSIPESWKVMRVKNVVDLVQERCEDKSVQTISLENIESFTGKYIKTDSSYSGDGILAHVGDILFGKLRPYLAKVMLAEKDYNALGDFYVMRCKERQVPEYWARVFVSDAFISLVNSFTYGAKMPRANWETISNILVPVPSYAEQLEIASSLKRNVDEIDDLVHKLSEQLKQLEELKKAITREMVTGKITS